MSEQLVVRAVADSLARVQAELDGLRDLPLDLATDEELLEFWRTLETMTRRLAAVEHSVIAQVSGRHLEVTAGARSMPAFARSLLGIDVSEARTRVVAAEACGPRQALSGEPLPPICPALATAQGEGLISNRHARIIIELLEALPDVVQVEQGEQIEAFFVEQAQVFDPATLRKLAAHQLEVLGVESPEPDYRDRRRDFRMHVRPDGSCSFHGEGTAEFAEYLRIGFDAYAKPRPTPAAPATDTPATDTPATDTPASDAATRAATATAGAVVPDPRTPGQRRHDAIIDLIKAAMRAGQIPPTGGLAATLVLTVDAEDWAQGTGTATTGHGVRVPTTHAKRWISGDSRVIAVVLDQLRAVLAYSDCHRIYTENQRLVMNARDGGCVMPGCDAPLHQCEAHHIIAWAESQRTSVDSGALMCPAHHRMFEQLGWRGIMIDGIPHLIPPAWIDPQQRPQRNWMHHPHLSRPPDHPARD